MKKDVLELLIYAAVTMMSGFLFFFGLMYPEYTYTEDTYCLTAPIVDEEGNEIEPEEFAELSQQEKFRLMQKLDASDICYKSKIWECVTTKLP